MEIIVENEAIFTDFIGELIHVTNIFRQMEIITHVEIIWNNLLYSSLDNTIRLTNEGLNNNRIIINFEKDINNSIDDVKIMNYRYATHISNEFHNIESDIIFYQVDNCYLPLSLWK